jgi:predicted phosphodiesterase
MYYEKQAIQESNRELNKIKKKLAKTGLVAEEVRNAFTDDIEWVIPPLAFKPRLKESNNKMVVALSDFHIGATIHDTKGNRYNYEIACKRVEKLKLKVLEYAKAFGVTEIVVANLGDMCENLYMRDYNQPFEAEFTLAEQLSKATKLLVSFLVSLSEYSNVSYFGVAGNHDRWFFSKNTVEGDNGIKVINEGIKTFIELSGVKRINYMEVEDGFNYEHVFKVGNKTFKGIHGDFDGKNVNLEKHIAMDEEMIDCIISGHYHYHKVTESNYGRLLVTNGSLMGRNGYARKFKATSNASQTVMIVNDEEIIPLRVDLQQA